MAMTTNPITPGTMGNVNFTDCVVVDDVDRPWLDATPGFQHVSAKGLMVRNPNGCTTSGLTLPVAQCETGPPPAIRLDETL